MHSWLEPLYTFFQWVWDLISDMPALFAWLLNPVPALSNWVGFNVSPLMLVGAGAITIGIIRAIVGLIID